MKKYITLIYILGLSIFVSAQNITQVEYFIDTDPGVGNGVQVTFTPNPDLDELPFSIDINAETDGFHTLYIRAKDENNNWSATVLHPFFKETLPILSDPNNIVAIEYFIDTDPGFGAGTQVTGFTPDDELKNFAFTVDLGLITSGFHKMFFRTRDTDGNWSSTTSTSFYCETLPLTDVLDITTVEYFIDIDPGYGNGNPVSFKLSDVDVNFQIDLTSVESGFHTLYIRTADADGNWSEVVQTKFFTEILPADDVLGITGGEYFFDTDPGYGAATFLPISGDDDVSDFAINITVPEDIGVGFHTLFFRIHDQNNQWSEVLSSRFFYEILPSTVVPGISYAEYFFDEDPGFGLGESLGISGGNDVSGYETTVPFPVGIQPGFHTLFMRAKDDLNQWSIPIKHNFYYDILPSTTVPNIQSAEYFIDDDPGFGNATSISGLIGDDDFNNFEFTIDLNAMSLTNGFHKLYIRVLDDNNNWSLIAKHLFYKENTPNTSLPQITEVEYFIDTDPSAGMGEDVTIIPATDIEDYEFDVDLSALTEGERYGLFARAKDQFDNWSITQVDSFNVCATDELGVAAFSYEIAEYQVTFTDESTNPGTYYWEFGTGAISEEANPVYTYPSIGIYDVCLTIFNDCNSSQICETITITFNNPPTGANNFESIAEDESYTFTAGNFGYNDLDGNPFSHIVVNAATLGEGDVLTYNGDDVANGMIIPANDFENLIYTPAPDAYGNERAVFYFWVNDGITNSQISNWFTINVSGINDKPILEVASTEITVFQNSGEHTITGWVETAEDNDPDEEQALGFAFQYFDGNSNILSYDPYVNVNLEDLHFGIASGQTGEVTYRVILSDYSSLQTPSTNTDTVFLHIEVTEFAATIDAGGVSEICTGEQVQFTTASSGNVTYNWTFGEGASIANSSEANPPAITYSTGGQKTISLTIYANDQSDTETYTLQVYQSPTAEFTTEGSTYAINSDVTFTNTSTSGNSFIWDFGDGSDPLEVTNTDPVTHTYATTDNATHTVVLTVVNGSCDDEFQKELTFLDVAAPNLSSEVFPNTVDYNGTANAQITVSDANGISKVQIFYKGLVSGDWNFETLSSLESIYIATITPAMCDQMGVEYYFEATNSVNLKSQSQRGYTYLKYPENTRQLPYLQSGTESTDYQIFTIPFDNLGSDATNIFEELGPYDNTQWRLLRYAGNGNYDEYNDGLTSIQRGKGYWLIMRNEAEIKINGTTGTSGAPEDFEIALNFNDWTQIGNPYTFDVSWADIKANNPAAAGSLEDYLIYNTGAGFETSTVFEAFRGGFIRTSTNGVTLKIPPIPYTGKKKSTKTIQNPIDNEHWRVQLNLQSGKLGYKLAGIGMHPEASRDYDRFDLSRIPRFIAYSDITFEHETGFDAPVTRDIVPPMDNYVWEFKVESNHDERIKTISWDNSYFGNGDKKLILYDIDRQQLIDMSEFDNYSFPCTDRCDFRIAYGDENFVNEELQPEKYYLGDCRPNPFKEQTVIPFTIKDTRAEGVTVELSIYNLEGRKIRTLANGNYKQGFYEIRWDGSSQIGAKMLPGIYVYKLDIIEAGVSLSKKLVVN